MKHSQAKNIFPTYLTAKDHLVTGEEFDLLYDETRQMLVTFPQPVATDLSKYYESKDYISHNDSSKGFFNFLYQTIKKQSLSRKIRLIENLNKRKGSLLDIGSGTGEFISTAKNNVWRAIGVEPNTAARRLADAKNLKTLPSLEEMNAEEFDVVTLWHVLEHLPDLESQLKKIEKLVKNGGYLIIAVPNFKSFDANYYGKFWAAYDVPRHLSHFSQDSFNEIISEKFKLVLKKPMWFDSFYVSLLSEKYKSGNKFSLKALFVGFWSNCKAIYTSEYSSIIYCFKKAD